MHIITAYQSIKSRTIVGMVFLQRERERERERYFIRRETLVSIPEKL